MEHPNCALALKGDLENIVKGSIFWCKRDIFSIHFLDQAISQAFDPDVDCTSGGSTISRDLWR